MEVETMGETVRRRFGSVGKAIEYSLRAIGGLLWALTAALFLMVLVDRRTFGFALVAALAALTLTVVGALIEKWLRI